MTYTSMCVIVGAIPAQRTRLKCMLVPRNVSLVRNRGQLCLGRFSDSPNVDSLSFRRQRQGRSAHYKLRRTTKLSGEQMPVLSHQAGVHATATYTSVTCIPQEPVHSSVTLCRLHSRRRRCLDRRRLARRHCLDHRRRRFAVLSITAVVVSIVAAVVSPFSRSPPSLSRSPPSSRSPPPPRRLARRRCLDRRCYDIP